ncbi:MAG: DUF5916 domain-containing protein [Lysobacterales bacterium]
MTRLITSARTAWLILIVATGWADTGLAASDPIDVPQIDASISVDGELDEPVWQQARQVELPLQTFPGENTPAPVATTVYLIDSGTSLLVAFRAEDPDPSAIRAFFRDRDSAFQDDFVGVALDTFNDERRALEFFANAYGAQMDLILDDVNDNEDESWDAIWDAAGKVHDFGYVVEMDIPYSALQLPADTDGPRIWGIDLLRFYPRDFRYRLSNNPQQRGLNCYLCQLEKFQGFANAKQGRDIEVTPTITVTRNEQRDEVTDASLVSGDVDIEPGLDVSWGVTPNITLNGTLNPDFSQVEADVAQLDVNTTFALFFPERRPFFLEGADFFETPINAVYTRSVVDPDYGLRMTGKTGANAFGVFLADDTVTNFLVPGSLGSDLATLDQASTNAVVRYRRDILNNSSVGLLLTARQGDDYHNHVGGVDALWRLTDSDAISFQYLMADSENPTSVVDDFGLEPETSGDGYRVSYEHNERNWFSSVRYEDYDDEFRADLGFFSRNNFDRAVVGAGYRWWGEAEKNWWNRIQIYSDYDITHDNDGLLLEEELEFSANIQMPLQSFVSVGFGARDRFFDDVLFRENFYSVYAETQPWSGVRLEMFARFGDQIDFANTQLGELTQINPELDLNLGKHLSISLDHTYQQLKRDEGEIFTANQTDLRFSYQFNLRQRLRLTVQYTDVERNQALYQDEVDVRSKRLGTQLIYSYKVNPRTVLFAGYSDNGLDNDEVDSIVTTSRTLFVKLGYAWEPTF